MSYVRNCKVCGQRISLREMQSGQWVAFDVSTDTVHRHGKRSKTKIIDLPNEEFEEYNSNQSKPNYGLFFIIAVIILGIWMFS